MEAESEEDAEIAKDSEDLRTSKKPPSPNNSPQLKTDKRVRFAASKVPRQTTHKKHGDGLPGSAAPRTGNPEGIPPSNKTQVSKEEIRRALERPLDYRKVESAPVRAVPSLLEASTSCESPRERATRIYQSNPRIKDNPEAKLYKTTIRWHYDRREVLVAKDPQAHAFKLGMPIRHGNRLELIHVRTVTGSNPDPSDTRPTGFPYTGTPQLKIVDLDETMKEVLKYLRSIEDVSNILAADIIHRRESQQKLGQLVDRMRKGTLRESPEDATFREILLLEAVSPAAAELILQNPQEASAPLFPPALHRDRGGPVAEHIEKLTQNTTTLKETNEIFDLHVPSRQWAPSVPGDSASLLQWKRNGNGSINYYAIFIAEAYEALAKAGKQSVQVPGGVDNRGRHIIVSITLEVGRWSAKGAGTIERQAPRTPRDREEQGARLDKIADTVASKLIDKVETKATQSTPETKTLLKNINKQLAKFNESKPVTVEELRQLHQEQELTAGKRHIEITQEVRGFHQTYRATGSAMVNTLTALTDRLTRESKPPTVDQEPLHFTKKRASSTDEDTEYKGIPYHGPKADPRKRQPPSKRQPAQTGDKTSGAEPPAKRRAARVSQTATREEAQLGSPRANPPITRKRTKEAAGLLDKVA
ncbi:hypothetical protein CYMTET_52070 [Cymbomonas tetramitiformis]|uniref:Uncharacterized protein n=1 Tax=Cymbomonas tetramitiformis TaxID=36881 RepID=A0AAE0ET40_9CHLO|nr:hypothetical protein CYMTET_52070 [Cymbomonas tetramitiformis]